MNHTMKLILLCFSIILTGCVPTKSNSVLESYQSISDAFIKLCEKNHPNHETSYYMSCQKSAFLVGYCSPESTSVMVNQGYTNGPSDCARAINTMEYQITVWQAHEAGQLSYYDAKMKVAESQSNLTNAASRPEPKTVIVYPPADNDNHTPQVNNNNSSVFSDREKECFARGKFYDGVRGGCIP